MKEGQFKIVKLMLGFPKMTPILLVKSWNKLGVKVTLAEINRAAVATNYEHYQTMLDEDINLLGEQLFGKYWKNA